jgi:hypothetical protein
MVKRNETSINYSHVLRNTELGQFLGHLPSYCDVYATNKTGSSSDDWIYYQLVTHSLIIALTHRQYSVISRLYTLLFTVANPLGFSVATSRFPATDLEAQTVSLTLERPPWFRGSVPVS